MFSIYNENLVSIGLIPSEISVFKKKSGKIKFKFPVFYHSALYHVSSDRVKSSFHLAHCFPTSLVVSRKYHHFTSRSKRYRESLELDLDLE